jgi:hypothetical protein
LPRFPTDGDEILVAYRSYENNNTMALCTTIHRDEGKTMAKDASGMRGERSRDDDGRLRRKRGDTRIETIENEYGVDFGVRGDMHLETLLEREGAGSLHQLLRDQRG